MGTENDASKTGEQLTEQEVPPELTDEQKMEQVNKDLGMLLHRMQEYSGALGRYGVIPSTFNPVCTALTLAMCEALKDILIEHKLITMLDWRKAVVVQLLGKHNDLLAQMEMARRDVILNAGKGIDGNKLRQ